MLTLTPGIIVNMPQRGRLSYIVDTDGESYTYLFRSYELAGGFYSFLHNVYTGDYIYLHIDDDWTQRYNEAWGPTK
jgi:hypothetical protein